MSYEVLARKWRPQRFEEVVGQEHVTTTLVNALRQGRVAHAYLFSGLRGVGKTTCARILAKAVNCQEGPTPTPCNQCTSCQEIARGCSLDCLEIDGASNRGVEEIRSLRERIGYAPVGGKRKVYIIDEVHMLTPEAFNALLKTLEEPPPHALFILATTTPRKVLATIQSRCQRFHFRRIPTAAIEEHLGRVATAEGLPVDAEALALVARRADGSLRDAESLLEQVASLGGGPISGAECRSFLGIMEDEHFFQAGRALVAGRGEELLSLLEELVRQGGDPVEFAEGLAAHLRHLLLISLDPQSPALAELSREELRRYHEEVKNLGAVGYLPMLERVTWLLPELRRSPQPRLELEVALLSMSAANRGAGEEKATTGGSPAGGSAAGASPPGVPRSSGADPGRTRKADASGAKPRVVSGPPDPAAATGAGDFAAEVPLTLEAVQQVWGDFVTEVGRQKRALAAFLAAGSPARLDGSRLVLFFPLTEKFSMSQVDGLENRRFLAGLLGRLMGGKNVGLSCTCLPAACGTPEGEPVVRRFLEAFDGQILGTRSTDPHPLDPPNRPEANEFPEESA